jgi:predicted nucleotidyltransferase
MRDEILRRLAAIEREHGVRVLYAAESGSRAWGFASPDSDCDVRFVYVRPREDYLAVDEPRDVIELPVNALLDVSGWDLRKALALFRKSNAPLYEWLQSPIVYRRDEGFFAEWSAMMADYFSPRAGCHHYLSMARNAFEQSLQGDTVRLKKYFYALRPLLAAGWILEKRGVPPMELAPLRAPIRDEAVQRAIDGLLERKRVSDEKAVIEPVPALQAFIGEGLARYRAASEGLEPRVGEAEPLNRLFRRYCV